MIKAVQSNPTDISAALANMPPEYRGIVEDIMKNMPQQGAVNSGEKKQ
ncbi:MAG: hypothetical protein JXL82_02225 [Candidatus Omnitrophica bacterium]|nr:hypothetical protein [Candidatus Omnitrophota bacterium]